MRVLIFLASVFIACPAFGATYYVKTGGNDGADGLSDANAWETVAKVNDYSDATGFQDNTTILFNRGDTFSDETLGHQIENSNGDWVNWVTYDGTLDGLTIGAYGTGDAPKLGQIRQAIWIDGQNGAVSNLVIENIDVSGTGTTHLGNAGLVEVMTVDSVTLDGLYGDGSLGGTQTRAKQGLIIRSCFGDIEIMNCEIFNQGKYGSMPEDLGEDYHSYHVRVIDEGVQPDSLTIHDNIGHDAEADILQIGNYNGPTNATVYGNTFYNFGENAIDIKMSTDVDIYDNDMTRGGWGEGGTGGGTSSIVTTYSQASFPVDDVTPARIKVYENRFGADRYWHIKLLVCDDCEITSNYMEGATMGGVFVADAPRTLIENNTIIMETSQETCTNTDCSGIRIADSGSATGTIIKNNTIISESTAGRYAIGFQRYSNNSGIDITNNIFEMTQNNSSVWSVLIDSDTGENPTLLDNLYYNANHVNRVSVAGTGYDNTDQASFRSAHDSGALFTVEPVYVDAAGGDFTLDYAASGLDGIIKYGSDISDEPVDPPQPPASGSGSGAQFAGPGSGAQFAGSGSGAQYDDVVIAERPPSTATLNDAHALAPTVLCWLINEGTGTTTAGLSPNAYLGSVESGSTAVDWTDSNDPSAGLTLPSGDNYATNGIRAHSWPNTQIQGSQNRSFVMRLKLSDATTRYQMLGYAGVGNINNRFTISTVGGVLAAETNGTVDPPTQYTYGTTAINDNTFHTLVVVLNGTNLSDIALYVDGVRETETTVNDAAVNTVTGVPTGNEDFIFGDAMNGNKGVQGEIQFIYAYDFALTSGQVADISNDPYQIFN